MKLKYLLAGAALAGCMMGAAASHAQPVGTVIGTEDPVDGFVGDLFPNFGYLVASDGESPFDPFHSGHDTTDGLSFDNVGFVWTQAADSSWEFLGGQTWVLGASLGPCGSENEPICEPTGHFLSPTPWNDFAVGTFLILNSDGAVSDKIVTFNKGGGAELLFFSDPTLTVPEPATWAIMLTGFFGLGAALRARRRDAVA